MCNTKICTDRGESFWVIVPPHLSNMWTVWMNLDARDVLLIGSNVNTMDLSKCEETISFDERKDYGNSCTAQRVRKRFVLDADF